MAWTKILLTGDAATELTGTAYRMLLVDSTGAVIELAHSVANKVLTSQGASANPTWEDVAATLTEDSVGATEIDDTATDIQFKQIILEPVTAGTGTTEGTLMFDSDDKHFYGYVA